MDSYRSRCNNNMNNMRRNGNTGNSYRMPESSRQQTTYGSFLNSSEYPVAMAYVPWQKFNETYDLSKALCVGTIFPELNQPFERARC